MKIKLAILLLVVGLIIISCKKEDKQPAPTTTNTTGGSGSNYYPASSATVFSGIFTTGNYVGSTIVGSTTYTFDANDARAYFSNSPQQYINTTTAVTVNKVYLNGDSLSYNSSYKYYTSINSVSLVSETWSVSGANGIGTFSITNNFITPSATGYLALPDSISLSSGFTVTINNVSNASSASIFLSDGGTGFYTANLQSGNNTLTITPANLSGVSTTTNGNLALLLSSKKAYTISSKDYQFNREFQFNKSVKIKP